MASSGYSTSELPALQAPDLTPGNPSYSVHALDTQAWLEGWAELSRSSTHRDGRFVLRTHGGRRLTSKGRIGARQAERVNQLVTHARDELERAALAAGWRADLSRVYWWPPKAQEPQQPAQEPQQPAQEPQQPAQEPQQPADSLLPWQGGELVSATSRRWRLAVADLAIVEMYHHAHTGRYEWLITPPNRLTFLAASGGPGYSCYSRAERAMLLALHRVLHPVPCLPTSLPPCEGAISASRRGE